MSGYPSGHVVTANEFEDESSSYTTAGTVASSTGTEVAMASWAGVDTSFTFVNGYLYGLSITGGAYNNGGTLATVERSEVRVRKGVNTTTGLQLLALQVPTLGGGNVTSFANHGYVKNSSGANITTSLGVTIQRTAGASSNSLFGDTDVRLMVSVRRIGLVSSLGSGIVGVAVAIT